MGFLNNLVSELTHSGQHGQQQHSGGPGQPPPVSPPWYAEWDGRDNRWLFVNQQTGERTFTYPGPGYTQQQGNYGGPQGGYGGAQGGYGGPQGGYGGPQSGYGGPQSGYGYGQNQGGYSNQGGHGQSGNYYQQEEHKKQGGNGWKYAAAGAAGLAGGALVMHEGEELKDDFERDKYRMENRVDEFGNDISNAPENAANWTGEQVGRVENFDDRVEQGWDNTVNDVENFPENAARWTGEKVQDVEDIPQDMENRWDNEVDKVEDFGDNMDNAYDVGRDEQRYDDDQDY